MVLCVSGFRTSDLETFVLKGDSQMQRATINRVLMGCVAGALALGLPASATAGEEKGWYIGGGLGQSKSDVDEAQFDSLSASSSTTSDEKDNSAWKLFGGYQFNRNWAVELAYVDLGKATAKQTVVSGSVNVDFEANGWNIAGVGTLPLSQSFSLNGKLGVFRWDRDYKCTRASGTTNCNTPANRSASGTDLSYGVGLGHALTKQTSLRLEWERFKDLGDENKTRGTDNGKTGQSDVDFLSIGIRYNFF